MRNRVAAAKDGGYCVYTLYPPPPPLPQTPRGHASVRYVHTHTHTTATAAAEVCTRTSGRINIITKYKSKASFITKCPGKHINYNHKAETPHKLPALLALLIRVHKSCRGGGPSVAVAVVAVVAASPTRRYCETDVCMYVRGGGVRKDRGSEKNLRGMSLLRFVWS